MLNSYDIHSGPGGPGGICESRCPSDEPHGTVVGHGRQWGWFTMKKGGFGVENMRILHILPWKIWISPMHHGNGLWKLGIHQFMANLIGKMNCETGEIRGTCIFFKTQGTCGSWSFFIWTSSFWGTMGYTDFDLLTLYIYNHRYNIYIGIYIGVILEDEYPSAYQLWIDVNIGQQKHNWVFLTHPLWCQRVQPMDVTCIDSWDWRWLASEGLGSPVQCRFSAQKKRWCFRRTILMV